MKKKTLFTALAAIVLIILLDQGTKLWITEALPYSSHSPVVHTVIDQFLYITHHHNYGASWGLFQGQTVFFIVVTLIALSVFVFFAKDMAFKAKPVYSVGLTLLIAGTIGNFIDRIVHGYVIDFIDTYIFTYDFPIFNVADMALTVGMAMFAFDIIILEPRRMRRQDDA